MKIQARFRNRILRMLLLSSLIPVAVWMVLAYWQSESTLQKFAERDLFNTVERAALRIEAWDTRVHTALIMLREGLKREGENRHEWLSILKAAANVHPSIYTAALADERGYLIYRSDDQAQAYYGDRAWFKNAMLGKIYREFVVSRVYSKPASCVSSAVSLKRKPYVVVICAFTEKMLSNFGELVTGSTGRIFIVDEMGRLLAHPSQPPLSAIDSGPEKAALELVRTSREGRAEFTFQEKTFISYSRTLAQGWLVIALQDKGEIVGIARSYLDRPLLFTLLTLALLLVLTIFVVERATLPLRNVSEALEQVGGSNFEVRVPVQDNELAILTRSFNVMAERLQSTFGEIKEKESLLERHQQDLQQQIREQSQKLLYSSKMSSLGEMAGGIAHEINNPLTIINIHLQKLRSQLDRTEALDKASAIALLDKMETTIQRITQIIRGLRTFSRDGSKDPFVLENISSVIQDAVSLCAESLRAKNIRLEVVPTDLEIECQPVQIAQVLLNLLSNAKDAVAQTADRWIKIETRDFKTKICISVTDSGSGVPENLRDKLMQPFFTTKEVGQGTGLGLSISKGIVEQHEGQLLYNSESQNTQFMVILPKHQTMSSNPKQPSWPTAVPQNLE